MKLNRKGFRQNLKLRVSKLIQLNITFAETENILQLVKCIYQQMISKKQLIIKFSITSMKMQYI
jgi:hypothetical protein